MALGGMNRVLGLGVILSMTNRLTGPAAAASLSMGKLTKQTEKAILAQGKYEAVIKAGTMALIGAAGISTALGFTVAEASKFETGMARVGAVLVPTSAQFDKLTNAAIKAGIATQWTPREAADGLKDLATAGFTAAEAHAALLPVLDLATGSLGQLGVASAATAAAAAVRGFGFEATETAKVVDILLRSTQLTNIQANDLQIMLSRISGNARAAGQEFEHTVAVLGALRNTGAEASVAATTLRSAFRQMTTSEAAAELEKLKVKLFDSSGSFRDFSDVVFDLNKVLSGMSEKESQAAQMAIFGARGMNAFSAVAAMGADKFKALEFQLKTAGGTAANFRKQMLEPLSGRILLLIGSIQTLATQIGKPLLAPIKILTTAFWRLSNFLIWITTTFPLLTKITVLTIGALTAVTALAGGMLLLAGIIGFLNVRYGLLAAAKAAYFFISSLVLGVEGYTRKSLLLSAIAERLKLTQTQLNNLETTKRIWLERILGIGISTNTSITYASVAAAWQERIVRLGNIVALKLQNAVRWISNKLTWGSVRATVANTQATIASSTAYTAGASGIGIFVGALRGLKIAMMTNPILLLATIVIGAVIAFYSLAKAFWKAEGAAKALFGFLMFIVAPGLAVIVFAIKAISSAWEQNVGGIQDTFKIMKQAIGGIFAPIGRLFNAMGKGSGKLNLLFKSIMKLVFIPLKKGFEGIARVATVIGAVIQIIVQEIEKIAKPLAPAINQLTKAFDELSVSVFGPGNTNLSIWKKFGEITRIVAKSSLLPILYIVTAIAKAISIMSRGLKVSFELLSKITGIEMAAKGKEPSKFQKILKMGLGFGLFLQKGGITKKGKPVTSTIGEGSGREVIQPLPPGMQPNDLKAIYDVVKSGAAGKRTTKLIIENRIFLDGREILRFQKEAEELEEMRGYGFGAA